MDWDAAVLTHRCPTCGGEVEFSENRTKTRCPHCGQASRISSSPSSRPTLEPIHNLRDMLLRVYCRVMIVLVLYVLSTGPMYWIVYEAYATGDFPFITQLYYPIALACENEWISRWFDWYVGLWVY